jgi:hypothetical protein
VPAEDVRPQAISEASVLLYRLWCGGPLRHQSAARERGGGPLHQKRAALSRGHAAPRNYGAGNNLAITFEYRRSCQ